MYISQQLVAWF